VSASLEVERRAGPTVVIRLAGEVDEANAADAAARLERLIDPLDAGVVLDLSAVAYLGSAGVYLLNDMARRLAAEGRRLRLVAGDSEIVRRLFEVIAMERALPVDATVDEALAALEPC
jgi:anti-sigma B factor antagonist